MRDSRGLSQTDAALGPMARDGATKGPRKERGKRTALNDLTNNGRGAEQPSAPRALFSQEQAAAPNHGAAGSQLPVEAPLPKVELEEPVVEPDEPEEEEDDADDLDDLCRDFYPDHPAYQPINVVVKNTFIELPNPCTPEKGTGTSREAIAATCPAKYALSEEERREYEEAEEEAEEAALQFGARKDVAPKVDMACLDPSCSVGSLLHKAQLCKPCAWYHHPKGCQRAGACEFCHMCPPGEIKRRKKEKTLLIRKRKEGGREEAEPSFSHPDPGVGIDLESTSPPRTHGAQRRIGRQQQQGGMFLPKNTRESPLAGVLPSFSHPDYPDYDSAYQMYNMQNMQAQFANPFPPQVPMTMNYPYPTGVEYPDYGFSYW